MSRVFFTPATLSDPDAHIAQKLDALWERAAFDEIFSAGELSALKLHVGEPNNETFAQPRVAKSLARLMARTGARPFLTDTAVLYKSPRDNGPDHVRVAHDHGFGIEAVGFPFIPADGVNGADDIEVDISALSPKHFDKVAIAAGILHARSMLVLSHATGHLATGLGGALKNLGMGCCSKKAKLQQHHGHQPRIKAKKCTTCGTCAEWCPSDAITVGDETAVIDAELCIGCGECIATCMDGAVTFKWGIAGHELQERIVEHAAGVAQRLRGKIAYVTVAQSITKDCDCIGKKQAPVVDDIGFLASTDPVALDLAVLQLVAERAGQSLEALSYPKLDGTIQIHYAAELGLGEAEVELVEL